MRCEEIRTSLLTDYRDGELDESEAVKVEKHLTGCAKCREFAEKTEKDLGVLRDRTILQPDPMLWQSIKSRIESDELSSEGWMPSMKDAFTRIFRPLPMVRMAFVTAIVVLAIVMVRFEPPVVFAEEDLDFVADQMDFFAAIDEGDLEVLNGDLAEYDSVLDQI